MEDSSTETYSDPRIKKQRISHCSQTELPPVNKANTTSCPSIPTAIKSEKVTAAPAIKTQPQERKKRKRSSLDTKIEAISSNIECPNPISHDISSVKSEKVVSVPSDDRQCRETKRKMSFSNQNESSSGGKVSPKVQMPGLSKSTAVKPGDKLSFQEAKELRRKKKNRS